MDQKWTFGTLCRDLPAWKLLRPSAIFQRDWIHKWSVKVSTRRFALKVSLALRLNFLYYFRSRLDSPLDLSRKISFYVSVNFEIFAKQIFTYFLNQLDLVNPQATFWGTLWVRFRIWGSSGSGSTCDVANWDFHTQALPKKQDLQLLKSDNMSETRITKKCQQKWN